MAVSYDPVTGTVIRQAEQGVSYDPAIEFFRQQLRQNPMESDLLKLISSGGAFTPTTMASTAPTVNLSETTPMARPNIEDMGIQPYEVQGPPEQGLLSSALSSLGDFGGSLLAQAPSAVRDIADTMRFYEQARMSQPQLVTASDLDKLRPITPLGVYSSLDQLRAQEQQEMQAPLIEMMKAQSDLARASASGRPSLKHPTKYKDVETGKEFVAFFDESLGNFVDPSTGKILDPNRHQLAESAGMKSKRMPDFGEMLSLQETLQDDFSAIRSIKRFRKSLAEREFGIKGKIDDITSKVKVFFKGADANLTPKEFYNSLSRSEQQGLLGLIRESVVGGGVMTEFDAVRVLERMGGDVSKILTAGPQVFGQATKDIMDDIYRRTTGRLEFYNRGAEFHGFNKLNLDELTSDTPDVSLGEEKFSPDGSSGDRLGLRE